MLLLPLLIASHAHPLGPQTCAHNQPVMLKPSVSLLCTQYHQDLEFVTELSLPTVCYFSSCMSLECGHLLSSVLDIATAAWEQRSLSAA